MTTKLHKLRKALITFKEKNWFDEKIQLTEVCIYPSGTPYLRVYSESNYFNIGTVGKLIEIIDTIDYFKITYENGNKITIMEAD